MLLQPVFGELSAVLIEVPVMLLLCWILCARSIAILRVPPRAFERAVMGAVALALLLLGELILAWLLFGAEPAAYVADAGRPERWTGLLGQVVFGLFPLLQLALSGRAGEPGP
ncbi:MAG: hypothetical protein R3F41_06460 [Gammaproteobacteria bacterium]|nr:hypothetical protein [Pseudomonadales bacterium]MCP5348558.1 hypothetical protein [Pseudomonadales bacterium]